LPALTNHLLDGRVVEVDDAVVVDLEVVAPRILEGIGLAGTVLARVVWQRHLHVLVLCQVLGSRIIRRVRARKPDLQEERLVAGIRVEPVRSQSVDEVEDGAPPHQPVEIRRDRVTIPKGR
jgi:hypothetical protein